MAGNYLEVFIEGIRSTWGPLGTEMVAGCRRRLEELLKAPATEAWLRALHADAPPNKALYRDPIHGFALLAHSEYEGLYRPPHDHGRSWVIYPVQRGEIEMGTFVWMERPDGNVELVKREAILVRAGEVKVFLPGDIHDTRCNSETALLFRFTERDLKKEEEEAGLVTRFVERDGVWTVETP